MCAFALACRNLVVYHTNKKAEEFNSEMWTVTELGEESFKMQRQILDVDVEQGLSVNDNPVQETSYTPSVPILKYKFWFALYM